MYQGKYSDGSPPPGYSGVAYQVEAVECDCAPECESAPIPCEMPLPAPARSGILDKLFSHKLDLEDLLLLALIVMTMSSGADAELVTMLVLLFIIGL